MCLRHIIPSFPHFVPPFRDSVVYRLPVLLATLSAKIFGVTNFRTKACPKIYLYEIWYCPKICHAENFLTDMRMCSVNSMTKTGTETRNMKANLNHGVKDYRKHAKF